jgi:hypothetical protein
VIFAGDNEYEYENEDNDDDDDHDNNNNVEDRIPRASPRPPRG